MLKINFFCIKIYNISYRAILKLGSQCNQDSGILGQGSTFFVREILDGIGAKPGGAYHHSVGSHRRALPQSRQVFHAAPWGASDPKTCCTDNF